MAHLPTGSVDPRPTALRALGCADGPVLRIGGVPASELVARFGSPLYAFDGGVLAARLASVRAALGDDVEVLYSIKANSNVAVAARLREGGAGAEIASVGELRVAQAAGFAAESIQFAGPGKSDHELREALRCGVGAINVESPGEARRLGLAARELGTKARVQLRVNPTEPVRAARLRMAGGSRKFGVDAADAPGLLRAMADDPHVEIVGVHQYAGTQCFDADAWLTLAESLLRSVPEWEQQAGVRLGQVNLGGGFGVPCQQGDSLFDLERAGRGLSQLRKDLAGGRRVCVELGRYLTAPAGVFLTTVLDLKHSGDRLHAVLDGGVHHCAAAGGFGSIVRRPWAIVVCDHLQAPHTEALTLGGPLCTPQDEFPTAGPLPAVRVGDVVGVLNVGAYGLSYSPTGFLSHATPAEVLVERSSPRLVRGRGAEDAVLRGQHWD